MIPHYPRPKILNAIPLDAHAVIEASAGTGKTFAIENMVVELLLRDKATLGQILVLTFTERAAAELRQRIRAKLEEIRFNPCQIGSCSHGVPRDVWQIDESVRRSLDQALLSFDAAPIGTIHGFFGRVLAEHAFDSGQLFDGKLVDGRTLFAHAFKTALRTSFARPPGESAQLLSSWLEQKDDGVEKLEELLYKCQVTDSLKYCACSCVPPGMNRAENICQKLGLSAPHPIRIKVAIASRISFSAGERLFPPSANAPYRIRCDTRSGRRTA